MSNNWRLFVDMDGVLARFNNTIPSLDILYEKGYYRNLLPQSKVLHAINSLISQYPNHIYIASAALDSPYAKSEKLEWIHEFVTELPDDHVIFTEYGKNKADFIPEGIHINDYLMDDYTQNLNQWKELGGTGIKLINNINHTNKSWLGSSIRYDQDDKEIENDIERTIMKRTTTVYHGSKSLFHEFDYDHIGEHSTTYGFGFYFGSDSDVIKKQYLGQGEYFYKTSITTEKALDTEKITITTRELNKLINAMETENKDILLSNYGDISYGGYETVKKQVIDDLLNTSHSDADIIGNLVNSGLDIPLLFNDLYEILEYDHFQYHSEDGDCYISLLAENIHIDDVYQKSDDQLIPVRNPKDTVVNVDVNYVDYDISSIQEQIKELNQVFQEALKDPENMPDIRINLQVDNGDVLKNERITYEDLQSHESSVMKQRESSLIGILKDKSLQNLVNPRTREKLVDLFDNIVIEELQIVEMTQTLGT